MYEFTEDPDLTVIEFEDEDVLSASDNEFPIAPK